MKYRNFICRLIAAVIMVMSVCSSLPASAVEGVSFAAPSPARPSQTYTSTVSAENYVPYSTDTIITPAAEKASAEADEDAPVISLSSPYTYVPSNYSGYSSFYLDFDVENASSYEFYSSNTSYATVNSDGYVRVYSSYYSYDVTITLRAYYLSDTSKYVEKSVTIYTPVYTTTSRTTTTTTTTTPPPPEIYLVDPNQSDLYVGNTFKLDYYLSWTFGSSPTFSSSDTSIASVDSSGNVTVNGAGTVTISAKVGSYSYYDHSYDSVTFTTYDPIKLSKPDESNFTIGNTFPIKYTMDYPFDVKLTWSSDDESIASVDSSGNVTINGLGPVTITAKAIGNGTTHTDSVKFTSYAELALGKTYSSSIKSSNSNWFKFTAPAEGAYIFESTGSCNTVGELFSAMSQGTSLAYNDDGGTISNFKITYSLTKGQTVWLEVTGYNGNAVSAYDVSVVSDSGQTAAPAIVPSSLTMNPGDTGTLFAINVPDGASVLWTSDNTSVVTVSDGVVKAIAPGTAKVFAIVGSTLCSCTVNVVSKDYNPGDVDGSGTVEIADAVKIMCYLTDPDNNPIDSQGIINGDVYQTGDGLSVQDALTIQKYLSQIITSLTET